MTGLFSRPLEVRVPSPPQDIRPPPQIYYSVVQTEFIDTSNITTEDTEINKEEITEEDPLSDTNTTNTLQFTDCAKTVIKNEQNTGQMMFKEELEGEDCDIVTKIEIVDDMLPLTKTEDKDLQESI